MPRPTRQHLISQGVLTPSLLASILNVSVTYIRKLCRSQSQQNKALETFNIASTLGKHEHRIHPSSAIKFCRESLGLLDTQIPQILFDMEKNATRNAINSMLSIEAAPNSVSDELINIEKIVKCDDVCDDACDTAEDNSLNDILIDDETISKMNSESEQQEESSDTEKTQTTRITQVSTDSTDSTS